MKGTAPRAVLRTLAATAACIALSQPVIGQNQDSSAGTVLRLPSGVIPTEIYGVPCKEIAGTKDFAPSLRCMAQEPTKLPSTSVSVQDSSCERTQDEMMASERQWMNDGTPFFNVVWERPFNPPSVKGGRGFKGFYQKSMGNRYSWATCGDGKLTQVLVIMLSPVDNEKLKAEVEMKIFGVSATAADSKGSEQ